MDAGVAGPQALGTSVYIHFASQLSDCVEIVAQDSDCMQLRFVDADVLRFVNGGPTVPTTFGAVATRCE